MVLLKTGQYRIQRIQYLKRTSSRRSVYGRQENTERVHKGPYHGDNLFVVFVAAVRR